MSCFDPLHAYQSLTLKTPSGKNVITFDATQGQSTPYEKIRLPCGQCIGCRLDRSRQWAVRISHEASCFQHNAFITLTFAEENINLRNSLVKKDFQNFMKKLRKEIKGLQYVEPLTKSSNPYPIRYFHCGEYGEKFQRPHHHACLFNIDFNDKVLWSSRKGVDLYHSDTLDEIWGHGMCTIGEVNYASAAYVARYITKKINGLHAASHYYRVDEETGEQYYLEPEYITMSRRPGIGARWFNRFGKSDVYAKDFVTVNGKKFKPPKYYDTLYDNTAPNALAKLKHKRKLAGIAQGDNNTIARLKVRATCARARNNSLIREFEK